MEEGNQTGELQSYSDRPLLKPGDASQAGAVAVEEPRHEVLIRQVETRIAMSGKKDEDTSDGVPFSKLYSSATGKERCMLYAGWAFAAMTGSVLPTFFFFMGPVFDAFGGG